MIPDATYTITIPLTRPVKHGDAEYRSFTLREPTAGEQLDAFDAIPAADRADLNQAKLETYLAAHLCGVPVAVLRRVSLNDYRVIVGHIANFPYSQAAPTTCGTPSSASLAPPAQA